jgi:hypothetical protein
MVVRRFFSWLSVCVSAIAFTVLSPATMARARGEILPTGMSITRAAIQDLMLKKQQAAQASASADAVKNQGSNFGAQN